MDRRFVLAIVLMMAVLLSRLVLFPPKPPVRVPTDGRTVGQSDSGRIADTSGPIGPGVRPSVPPPSVRPSVRLSDSTRALPEDTITVASALYRYGFSTRGARLIEASFLEYASMNPAERGRPAQILYPQSNLLSLGLLTGRDTVWMSDWHFTPSAPSLTVTQPTPLTFTAEQGQLAVSLTYSFRPADYLMEVSGTVRGAGPNGGTLLIGMGPGLRNTESDSVEHYRELGVVVKGTKADLTRFSSLTRKEGDRWLPRPMTFNGPFEWVAIKSKYFVTALLALDTTGAELNGGISGASAVGTDMERSPTTAAMTAGISLPASGLFRFQVYTGPMEYPRLRAIGHDFDDINPYGWPGFRTIIRPVALGARSLLVWMHDGLGLAYGIGLILFGILIRVLLWPLNQKAMRSTMAMQSVQPLIKELQEKYKSEPQKLQQEMFKLYKEHNVNPFGGCWPMLLPWPILLALFFVFQNTIELRGASFLWLPDLSRPDPTFVIPILMGVSMFALSWIGQRGMPPNPQTKMMLYLMPGMMTFLFLNFAAGLNLYYTVMNLASLPQQWMLTKERQRRGLSPPPKPLPGKK